MPSIEIQKNGPYLIKNLDKVVDSDGKDLKPKEKRFLCRCGRSLLKPYCDGTHVTVNFNDESNQIPTKEPETYIGDSITVSYNRSICSHSDLCVAKVPDVFHRDQDLTIMLDESRVEDIIIAVQSCPSGALSYTMDGGKTQTLHHEPAITIQSKGPYRVQGDVALESIEQSQRPSDEHYCLCRCGESQIKPFCNGSHKRNRFRDDSFLAIAKISELSQDLTRVTIDKKELVIVKREKQLCVFSGVCLHAEALLAEGFIEDDFLTCGKHLWKYNIETGELDGEPKMKLFKLTTVIEQDLLLIDAKELETLKPMEDE